MAYLVVLCVCIMASGFFSGSETALVGVARERVEQLLTTDPRASKVAALLEDQDRMLSTLLVANNFVNILGASVATVLFIDLLGEDWGPWVSTAAVTAVILVVGEITPKSLATRFPERFSLTVAPTIWRLSVVLRPISRFFVGISRGLFRLFRIRYDNGGPSVTDDDIRALAALGERTGFIATAEREIIHSLFSLADLRVRDVMSPRVEIQSLESPVTMADVRAAVGETGHSRFPIIKEDLDHVLGVLYVKDLLGMPGEPTASDVNRVLRTPHYVPETKPVLDLLIEMRTGRRTFAMVTDEHGGIEGIVTIKDLVGELVGELQDEYDPDEPTILALDEAEWLSDGRVTVEDLEEQLDAELPAGEYTTVAGLVLDLAGRIPEPGDRVDSAGFGFEVIRMDRHRVDRVRITRGSGIG